MSTSLPPWGSASSSLIGLSHGICWATSFSTAYVQRAFHQPGFLLPTYKELSTSLHVLFATVEPPSSSSPTNDSFGALPQKWPGVAQSFFLGHAARLVAGGGEAEVWHDKTCLPELPKVSLFCFLVCGTLTRSGRSIWQWVTNSRLPRESAAQPGRAQECWLLGLAVTTRSCFPRGCPSKALTGEYSAEISPVMRISYCNSWQNWIAADLWGSVQIFSNSSFETPLPPSVLPFASISHFYLMGCFCVCFVSCKFQ